MFEKSKEHRLKSFSDIVGGLRYDSRLSKINAYDWRLFQKQVQEEARLILKSIQNSIKAHNKQIFVTEEVRKKVRDSKEWQNFIEYKKAGFLDDSMITECGEIIINFEQVWKKFFNLVKQK